MSSMSGGSLRRSGQQTPSRFRLQVSMPSMPDGSLRRARLAFPSAVSTLEFLCPRCRARLCDDRTVRHSLRPYAPFLCPRCRAGLCDGAVKSIRCSAITGWRFYALDAGRVFATDTFLAVPMSWVFGVRCAILSLLAGLATTIGHSDSAYAR